MSLSSSVTRRHLRGAQKKGASCAHYLFLKPLSVYLDTFISHYDDAAQTKKPRTLKFEAL